MEANNTRGSLESTVNVIVERLNECVKLLNDLSVRMERLEKIVLPEEPPTKSLIDLD